MPWWAQPPTSTDRKDAWSAEHKLKRPANDLFIYRDDPNAAWKAFSPARRVRLRNGRPDPQQADTSLFAIEQIVEETHFLAELQGTPEDMHALASKLAAILDGRRWLRVGRAGAPVEVAQIAWSQPRVPAKAANHAFLTLTSDLLIRDEELRWRTALDEKALRTLFGTDDVHLDKTDKGQLKHMQDSAPVHGFNGTSRLWRMPATAIRRGSVFSISGGGIATIVERATTGSWLGERTHEGFGRFRVDATLPGVGDELRRSDSAIAIPDADEESIAVTAQEWFKKHKTPAKSGSSYDRKPSLSQWLDLVADLERSEPNALSSRLSPTTAGGKSWKQPDAKAILNALQPLPSDQRQKHARLFVRWLRAAMRKEAQ